MDEPLIDQLQIRLLDSRTGDELLVGLGPYLEFSQELDTELNELRHTWRSFETERSLARPFDRRAAALDDATQNDLF
ncbi:hypothetical protein [Blastopirellula marina]|uniref:Uncharacterized protein n=1 Tax=Blastopirellula marina DSM 3645 TaxID=314230 RepID=A3ZQY8_9BACT|nr:hypothetical protein [Blastopirellula marina]EAQ81081.1 hypothetical protein DSM3645_20957 [Blastopirellula marina DSM 3645]